MNSDAMIYDVKKVSAAVEVVGETMVAIKPISIVFPARYLQRGLAMFEDEMHVVGYCAFVVDRHYYATSLVGAPFKTEPSSVMERIIDDVPQVELVYKPGDLVMTNINLMVIDALPYRIFDEFIAKGRKPWFIRERDAAVLFKHSGKHNGVEIGPNPAVFSIIAANIYRDESDTANYYRQTERHSPPAIVPLRSTAGTGSNAMAKLLGNHFEENVTSAIVYPSERLEPGDRILRV